MSSIGMVGMGKLGLPVALAIEGQGHEVHGYDVSGAPYNYLANGQLPYQEKGIQPYLDSTRITMHKSIGEVVANSDIVFLAIQTPHGPEYEGATPLPDTRADFDYRFLKRAIGDAVLAATELEKPTTLVTISTCLPGTYKREIQPMLKGNEYVSYAYGPQFIAMGTVIDDYLHPEFNLIGVEDEAAADQLEAFYDTINDAPHIRTDITTAEAIKVSYNTWITAKTVIANLWGEMAHKTGANFDDIQRAWSVSTKRLLSDKYTRAGVGDGGGCHPRDNIALSHIAKEVGLSHDLFEDLMKAREDHMGWLASEAAKLVEESKLMLVVLGRSFKPETNIETGSPAVLMSNLLKSEHGLPHLHVEDIDLAVPCVVVIGTQHERYRDYKFPEGSIVLDPFRYIPDQPGVKVIRIGGGDGSTNKRTSDRDS